MPRARLFITLAGVFASVATAFDVPPPLNPQLQTAYDQIYDLNFSNARQTLTEFHQAHPDDPMGPLSDAAAYMFEQFHRLSVLKADFLSPGGKIFGTNHTPADPHIAQAFDSELDGTKQSAAAALRKSPDDVNALLAGVLAITLRADYNALVRQHGWQALTEIKQGTARSHHLLSICSTCYDADLASGVENYILGQQSGFARLILHFNGAQTDEEKGLRELRIVADKGAYFKTYAKVLLAIAAIRAHDNDRARKLIAPLVAQYPHNDFFRDALHSIH